MMTCGERPPCSTRSVANRPTSLCRTADSIGLQQPADGPGDILLPELEPLLPCHRCRCSRYVSLQTRPIGDPPTFLQFPLFGIPCRMEDPSLGPKSRLVETSIWNLPPACCGRSVSRAAPISMESPGQRPRPNVATRILYPPVFRVKPDVAPYMPNATTASYSLVPQAWRSGWPRAT